MEVSPLFHKPALSAHPWSSAKTLAICLSLQIACHNVDCAIFALKIAQFPWENLRSQKIDNKIAHNLNMDCVHY